MLALNQGPGSLQAPVRIPTSIPRRLRLGWADPFFGVAGFVYYHGTRRTEISHAYSNSGSWLSTIQMSSSPLAAQPLKVASANGSSKGDQGSRTPVQSRDSSPGPGSIPSSKPPLANPADISSPHELTAFVRFQIHTRTRTRTHPTFSSLVFPCFQVETLLEQLDTKFDDMSSQIIERSALLRSHWSCRASFMYDGIICVQ